MTRAERELVRAVLSGASIPKMAALLEEPPVRLKERLDALYAKFGARTRHDLAMAAIRRDDV